ncbi:hypothetical protein HZH66_000872 [Vespula vulgaris]|uniref:Uncharacterized protein n=1 Tax=Vespula vulgaris TaxID=7454 RepID=A0A834KXP3_VESVU|nr:hypothetical protein HZH66_000872 [Vespula vulgaris]
MMDVSSIDDYFGDGPETRLIDTSSQSIGVTNQFGFANTLFRTPVQRKCNRQFDYCTKLALTSPWTIFVVPVERTYLTEKWLQMIIRKDLTNILERIRLSSTKLVLMTVNLAPMLPRGERAKKRFPLQLAKNSKQFYLRNEADDKSFEALRFYDIYYGRRSRYLPETVQQIRIYQKNDEKGKRNGPHQTVFGVMEADKRKEEGVEETSFKEIRKELERFDSKMAELMPHHP